MPRKTPSSSSQRQPEIAGRLQQLVEAGDTRELARRSLTLQSVMLDLHRQLAAAQSQAELARSMGLALTGSFACERLVVLRRDRVMKTFESVAEIGDVSAELHEEAPAIAARLAPFLPHVAPLTPLLPPLAAALSETSNRLAGLGFVRTAWLTVEAQVDWLVLVGPKLSGAEYDTFDSSLLRATLDATSLACSKLLLVDAIEERNRELLAANRRLRQIDDLKTAILLGVSHELRTPLHRIHMFAEALRDEPPGAEESRRFLDVIMGNAKELGRLIDSALRFADLIGGRSTPQPRNVSLAEVVQAVVEQHAIAAAAHSLRLVDHCEPLAVVTDADHVRMILGCLVDNAVKFTPPGGEVRIDVLEHDAGAVVRVSDTGPGIPEEARDRIWRLFETGDLSLEREKGGLGIGLALAQRLASELGVHLELVSSNASGSVFALLFPDAAPSRPKKVREPRRAKVNAKVKA